MSHVVAFIDQYSCRTYQDRSLAPVGSIIFESPKELEQVLDVRSMDLIREKLLNRTVEPSPSRKVASKRLWHTLSLSAEFEKTGWSIGYVKQKDGFGNKKIASTCPIELIQLIFVKGQNHMTDHFYKTLPRQARQMLDMLIDDGREVWTNEQADAVVLARGDEVRTKQEVLAIFHYYKSKLFNKKLLKKMSYVEFVSRPEFSGTTLQDV